MRTTADLLASAEQSERVALGRYKAGVGNILDVLNAQSALASARLQRIQSLLDWHVSRATLGLRRCRRPRQPPAPPARRKTRPMKAKNSTLILLAALVLAVLATAGLLRAFSQPSL